MTFVMLCRQGVLYRLGSICIPCFTQILSPVPRLRLCHVLQFLILSIHGALIRWVRPFLLTLRAAHIGVVDVQQFCWRDLVSAAGHGQVRSKLFGSSRLRRIPSRSAVIARNDVFLCRAACRPRQSGRRH